MTTRFISKLVYDGGGTASNFKHKGQNICGSVASGRALPLYLQHAGY